MEAAQGSVRTEGFYWNLDERTRVFFKRFEAQNGTVPSAIHVVIYSSVRHYLQAVAASKSDERIKR